MTLETLRQFFFWCLVIDVAIYLVSAVCVLAFRDPICRIQARLMGVSQATALHVIYGYLAAFKLLILVFNLAPWIALLLVTP